MKRCKSCQEVLPFSAFNETLRKGSWMLADRCKPCVEKSAEDGKRRLTEYNAKRREKAEKARKDIK